MVFEKYEPNIGAVKKEKEERCIYPERGLFSVDKSIEKLKKILNGEIERIHLSESERSEMMSFENELGTELEEIFKIKVKSAVIHPEYLLTGVGKGVFRSCVGFDIEAEDQESIEKVIYCSRNLIAKASGVQLKDLTARSKKYSEDRIIEQISQTMTDSGEIDIENIPASSSISVILNPEKALEKIRRLREFKRKIKDLEKNIASSSASSDYLTVADDIINQYRERVNELIVEQFGHVVRIKELAGVIGKEYLSDEEIKLLEQFSGLNDFVSVYSRFDKFVFGIDGEADSEGNYKQIGQGIGEYAAGVERRYIENERSKKQKAASRGLDYEKIKTEDITSEVFSKYAEAFLARCGQKSSEPAELFDPNREGPASDGKWQFAPSFSNSSMDFNFRQRVIKAPAKNRSIVGLVAILLGHEFTHFIQGVNQQKLDLRLLNEVCGNRRQILAEGAAMSMQNQISEELFGFQDLPKPFYVKAMSKKINGGNYLDCVKEYYDSSMKVFLETTDKKNPKDIKKEAERALGVAVRSCKRLFKGGEDLNSKTAKLSKSKDTVYIEQLVVTEKLKEVGLEKFAMVRGINLDSLFILLKDGLINENDIESVDLDFIRNVWQELKGDYALAREN